MVFCIPLEFAMYIQLKLRSYHFGSDQDGLEGRVLPFARCCLPFSAKENRVQCISPPTEDEDFSSTLLALSSRRALLLSRLSPDWFRFLAT